MFIHAIDPVLLRLGPLQVRWYGILYAAGFLLTYLWAHKAVKEGRLRMHEDDLDMFFVITIAAVVVGARLFEVLFYNPSYYLANPWKVFAVWEGGLSFHGGLVGGFLAGSLYVRRKGIRPLAMADMLMPAVALANALGRIGNFINGELPGKLTTLPWGVQFPGYEGFRHPTQLYEAAYDLVIAAVLLILWRKKLPDGRMVGWFLVLYAVLRFAVEFLKDIPLYGPLTLGQWFNIPLFAVGVWLLLRKSG